MLLAVLGEDCHDRDQDNLHADGGLVLLLVASASIDAATPTWRAGCPNVARWSRVVCRYAME